MIIPYQIRPYENLIDRLRGTAEETIAWMGFGGLAKGAGYAYKKTLGRLLKQVGKLPKEKATEVINVIEKTNAALSKNKLGRVREGITRKLLIFPGIKLVTPEITFKEIENHIDIITTKSKLHNEDIQQILDILKKNIKTIPESPV